MRARRKSNSKSLNDFEDDHRETSGRRLRHDKKGNKVNKQISKDDIVNSINFLSSKTNNKRLKNNLLGHCNDYYNLHYKFDDPNDSNAYLNSLDLYSAKTHNFVNETWEIKNFSSTLEFNAEFLFNANEFKNNLHYNNANQPYVRMRQRRRSKTYNKKEMLKFYKMANPKKKGNNDVLINIDDEDEEEDNEDEDEDMVLDDLDEIQISDEDDDSDTEEYIEEGSYCEGIVSLENKHIKLLGLATKNGYLNFKIIDKSNRINRDGISLYLNFPLKEINFIETGKDNHLGIVYCILTTGDLFFIDFRFDYSEGVELKTMVSYKYNILRKSLFQNSKFVDLKIVDSISSDNQLLYEFVVLDRYGNYTNGNLIYIFDEPTLKVNLNVSTSDDCKFKGSLFDIFNLELPYKQIILGPNEDTVFLFDNTKILSLNKKRKQSVLITQHKFWSKIIKCFDACDFVVLLTNMELIIVRKIEDEKGNAFLERVISIKHYFNLVKNSDLSLNAFNDDVNGVLFVFVKPLNILYIFNINSETNELSLMNNIPVSCIFAKLSKKNKKSIYLVKESLYFVSEVNGKENLQSFNLIENDVHKSNLKVIDKLIINSEVLRGNEKEEELINHHNVELKFEKEFSGRENINRYIQKNKEVNISLPSTLSESEQIDLLEEFGNNFYETLNERYGDENLYGSASMSNILPLPNEITNLAQFKDFNEQLCQSINTYTPFKIINQYDEDEKNIQKIWNNQLVLINVQNMNSKKKFVQKFKNRFKDDNFDLLKKGIDQWNPEKFKLLEIDKNYHIFNKSQSKSFNTYQSQKKTRNIISKDFEELDSINTSSQPLNSNSQKHLYSQSNIMSQWNDSSLVGSTQKQVNDKEVHLKLESDISEISGSQTTKKNKNTSKRVKKSSQQAVKKLKKPKKQKTIGGTSGFF